MTIGASSGNRFTENRIMRNLNNGIRLADGASFNTVSRNIACQNGLDAFDDGTDVGNVWEENVFCTASI